MERCEVQHKTLSGLLSMFSNDILIVLEMITEIDLVYMLSIYLCTLWVWGSSHPLPNNSPLLLYSPLPLNSPFPLDLVFKVTPSLVFQQFLLHISLGIKYKIIPYDHHLPLANTLQLWLVEITSHYKEPVKGKKCPRYFFNHIKWFTFLEKKSYCYKSILLSIGF